MKVDLEELEKDLSLLVPIEVICYDPMILEIKGINRTYLIHSYEINKYIRKIFKKHEESYKKSKEMIEKAHSESKNRFLNLWNKIHDKEINAS